MAKEISIRYFAPRSQRLTDIPDVARETVVSVPRMRVGTRNRLPRMPLNGFASRISTCFIAIAASLIPVAGLAQDRNLSLGDLEAQLIDSPALAAADTEIFGADQEVRYEADRGRGFDYFFENALGPRSDIVEGLQTNRTIRYGQLFGVDFPLFGTRLTEHLALVEAQSQANLARIAADGERRKLLDKLRDSYVKYWQYDREQAIVADFVALEKAEMPSARTFVREGFWTQASYMGFLDSMSRFQTDLRGLRSERRSALADIRAVLNNDVPERTPDPPDFQMTCSPSVDQAVSIAASNDPDVARYQEQQSEARASIDFIKHSSVTANFRLGLGTNFDIPQHAVGYNVTGTFGVSFPQHMRPEEDSKREVAFANIQMYRYLEMQRRSEIRAAVMNVLDQAAAAQGEFAQAQREQVANREMLREARVRYATIIATGATSFNEVQSHILDSYNAERKEASELGATYTSINAIENLVPNACVPFRLASKLLQNYTF